MMLPLLMTSIMILHQNAEKRDKIHCRAIKYYLRCSDLYWSDRFEGFGPEDRVKKSFGNKLM